MGPEAGAKGGQVIAEGTIADIVENKVLPHRCFSKAGMYAKRLRPVIHGKLTCLNMGPVSLSTGAIHTVKPLKVKIPKGRLTVVTGVSGSGKTTLILESLVPGMEAAIAKTPLPSHVLSVDPAGISQVKLIDATPIGINVRSTAATYANVHDELRKVFAKTADAKNMGYKAGDFSYNTGKLRCPVCDGTGQVSLDVQFLPDVDIPCPECRGSRYAKEASLIKYTNKKGQKVSLPELMDMDIHTALEACDDLKAGQTASHCVKRAWTWLSDFRRRNTQVFPVVRPNV